MSKLMKTTRSIANLIPFGLFCAGAYLTVKFNSGWFFFLLCCGLVDALGSEKILKKAIRRTKQYACACSFSLTCGKSKDFSERNGAGFFTDFGN